MRRHYDQVALFVFGCVDYGFPRVIVALSDSFDVHARRLSERIDDGEFFAGEFDRFGVDSAGKVFGNQAAWHSAVERLGHCNSNDRSLHELSEVNAVPDGTLAELGAVSRK
jgi:hypothetical protein